MKHLSLLFAAFAALVAVSCTALVAVSCATTPGSTPEMITTPVPKRAAGQTDVIALATEPLPVVRVGFIGLGQRGPGAVNRFTFIEGVEIVALCDLYPERVEDTQKRLTDKGLPRARAYSGEEGWKELCESPDIDLVYICTPWQRHATMALYAMEQGKHVASEVPAAMTLDECWALVDTAERTRRHCMMLENCCYDFFEMATLNMAQNGVFGDIVHVEGAYLHDLRELQFNTFDDSPEGLARRNAYQGHFRLEYNAAHTGNPYPTHGLGPIAQILGLHRGDKMNYLVSLSSAQKGMTEYARERFGADSPEATREYKLGDMNTTLVYTERGRSMMIQHDVTSPRPYSRLHTVSGTDGYAQKYPVQTIAVEPNPHSALSGDDLTAFIAKWEHPITREVGELARSVGGHGGMDFIMDYRLVYCLRNGLPLDQDVYDAAEWSCIVPLSEISVLAGSAPVAVPDFTRGAWNKVQGFRHAMVATATAN